MPCTEDAVTGTSWRDSGSGCQAIAGFGQEYGCSAIQGFDSAYDGSAVTGMCCGYGPIVSTEDGSR